MTRPSITRRITMLWTALFAAGLLAFALAAAAIVEHEGREALDSELATRAQEALNARARGQTVSVLGDEGVALLRGGKLVSRSGVRIPTSIVSTQAGTFAHAGTVGGYRVAEVSDSRYRAIAFAADSLLRAEAARIRLGFLAAAIPVLLLSAFAGWALARRSLRPVDEMARIASSIAASGDMAARLCMASDDELGRLASTFDSMLERLEDSFSRERRFIGDVSHELRTAVAAVTAIGEATLAQERTSSEYRASLESVVRRGRQLTTVIEDLLLLARADAGVLRTEEHADLNEIVVDVAAEVQSTTAVPVTVSVGEEPLRVTATPDLVARAIDNLIGNSIRSARMRTAVTAERHDGFAVVLVDDDGPGIPSEERRRIFRRFYRGAASYEGSGIGLALSESVVRAYGGTIEIGESPLGGARFIMSLPIAQSFDQRGPVTVSRVT